MRILPTDDISLTTWIWLASTSCPLFGISTTQLLGKRARLYLRLKCWIEWILEHAGKYLGNWYGKRVRHAFLWTLEGKQTVCVPSKVLCVSFYILYKPVEDTLEATMICQQNYPSVGVSRMDSKRMLDKTWDSTSLDLSLTDTSPVNLWVDHREPIANTKERPGKK